MNAKNRILVGMQWGDEGKGKVTDLLAKDADVIARFSGGPNAGHTVIANEKEHKLHQIPSGILHPEKINVIGNGAVIDLQELVREIQNLEKEGVSTGNLFISDSAHIILKPHIEEDERDGKIGTTKKGIGPCYMDKARRTGIRIGDLACPENLQRKLAENFSAWDHSFGSRASRDLLHFFEAYRKALKLDSRVINVSLFLDKARRQGKRILFEGAQGTMLDIDHGTYPYATSSNATAGGACTGTGFPPTHVDEVIGVTKAYTTRVGEGPFPTEQFDPKLEYFFRHKAGEVGSTTGRDRRCGWLDIPMLKHSIRVNGITKIALTKLDILSAFKEIPVCTHYVSIKSGQETDVYPIHNQEKSYPLYRPCYTNLEGWEEDIRGATSFDELPAMARSFVTFLEASLECKIFFIGVGPARNQCIKL